MKIQDILNGVPFSYTIHGSHTATIESVSIDSRIITENACFFAVTGDSVNGHDYIDSAIKNGASVIVCEILPENLVNGIAYVLVDDTRTTVGPMASIFYGRPSMHLKIIGVTGTNGKTTVSTMLYRTILKFHRKVALLSTNGDMINDVQYDKQRTSPTTPDAIFTQRFFKDAMDAGCEYVVMEVSSHSVVQHRIDGVRFTGSIFTNLSHDHLDYHHTIENYAKAKKAFFDNISAGSFALTNTDDEYGRYMVSDTHGEVSTYGFNNVADFGEIIESKLVGQFNQYNLLAVYGAMVLLGFESSHIKSILKEVLPPSGRFELVVDKNDIKVIVDYAHSPDGVENVLETARGIVKSPGRLIALLGSGGDRDSVKRPVMARIAYDLADIVILTSDNPRNEDPDKIISEMKQGLPEDLEKTVETIIDRHDAIKKTKEISLPGDVIMLLGKGHEDYQEINGFKHHFDDKEEAINAFS
jgi:UDP-N-acetylmuramoyl-L-alanyl-D-glutamate--2,6-diaminopimelate ligase